MAFQLRIPAGLEPVPPRDGAHAFSGHVTAGTRDGTGPSRTVECHDETVIELGWEDGTELMVRGDDLRSRSRSRGDVVVIPGLTPTRDGEAPSLSRVIVGVLAPRAARAVAHAVDTIGTGGHEGFCRVDQDGRIQKLRQEHDSRLTPEAHGARGELLLLIHGTFTSTEQTFSDLCRSLEWRRILQAGVVGEVAWGYDHPTLSQDPVQNATRLIEGLPDGARLNLISHSRGGLVADVLSAACATREPPARFDTQDRWLSQLQDDFAALRARCQSKSLRVVRSLRSGTPARGTTLASQRLDTWLNVFLNVVGLVPAFRASPIYGGIKQLLAAVVKERANPDIMPGIAAMIPEFTFVKWLSTQYADDDLTVIAADMDRPGFLGRLATVLGDLYYRQNNDLVVDTAAMEGGANRPADRPPRTPFGSDGTSRLRVHHLGYFTDPDVRSLLARELSTAPDLLRADAGGERGALGYLKDIVASAGAKVPRPDKDQPPTHGTVLLVPGIMGSVLSIDGEPVWPHLDRLAAGGLARLKPGPGDGVKATALLAGPYQRIIRFLSEDRLVVPFPYDWRVSLKHSARLLSQAMDAALQDRDPARPEDRVHVLAHSMGGLVARGVMAWHPDTWGRFRANQGRLVMLGTPNHGSWVVPRLLHGEESLLSALATVDLAHRRDDLVRVVSNFQGFLEMLPASPGLPLDEQPVLHPAWWETCQLELGDRLDRVRQVRADLGTAVDAERMVYVAGQASETACGVADGPEGRHFLCSADGDGRVLWTHGELPGVPMWTMAAGHGDMADRPWTFHALRDLLDWGTTARLPTLPRTRSASRARALPTAPPTIRATEAELVAAGVGGSTRLAGPDRPLTLAAVHGDLVLEEHVALVGHPEGDRLRGAEPALDLVYQGELRARLRAGRYPQSPPAVAVLPSPARRDAFPFPPAIVVVGLGPTATLTRAKLVSLLRGAFVELCLPPNQRLLPPVEGGRLLSIAAPGCVELGLPVEESVSATIEAALLANRELLVLAERDPTRVTAPIAGLRFVFTYGDQAAEAARVIRRWQHSAGIELLAGERIEAARLVETRRIAERIPPMRPLRARPLSRSRRLAAVSDPHTVCADAAPAARGPRTIEYLLPGEGSSGLRRAQRVHWPTVTALTAALTGRRGLVPAEIAALRAHVMPPEIAEQFETGLDLQLGVDAWTAAVPWEAFVSAGVDASAVLSGRIAVLRQLEDRRAGAPRDPLLLGNALLVCSPGGDERWPFLEGAVAEADVVRSALMAAGFAVQESGDDGTAIRAQLARPYEIVHLIGHGQFTPGEPATTGLVARGEDFISRLDLGPFLQRPPAFVFLNCCHLGQIDTSLHLDDATAFAADLATFLINSGVSAVVAAGWAVDDGAAEAFASELYQQLLGGQRFRHAVAQARLAAHARAPHATTWAAYQCYGDPDFVLPSAIGAQPTLDTELDELLASDDFVTAVEVEGLLDQVLTRLIYAQNDTTLARRLVLSTQSFFEKLDPGLQSAQARYRMGRLLSQLRDPALDRVADAYLRAAASDIANQLHGLPEPLRPLAGPLSFGERGDATLPAEALDASNTTALWALRDRLGLLLVSPFSALAEGRRKAVESADDLLRRYVVESVAPPHTHPIQAEPSATEVALAWKHALPPGTEPVTLEEAGFWLWTVLRALRDARRGSLTPKATQLRRARGHALLEALQAHMPQLLHDPNAGAYGHEASARGASVSTRGQSTGEGRASQGRAWEITATLEVPEDRVAEVDDGDSVELHLYPRYQQPIRRIPLVRGQRRYETTFSAHGSFTLGVVITRSGADPIRLEHDLGYTAGLEADVEFLRR